MATGRGSTAARAPPLPAAAGDAPRRPSLALQPFAWGGLQILPVGPTSAERVAVIPPPLPGLYRTAPFRVSEYDTRSRLAVASLEAALGLAAPEACAAAEDAAGRGGSSGGGSNANVDVGVDAGQELDAELCADLDLADLQVPLPPGVSRALPGPGPGPSPDPGPGPDSNPLGGEALRGPQGPRPLGLPDSHPAQGDRPPLSESTGLLSLPATGGTADPAAQGPSEPEPAPGPRGENGGRGGMGSGTWAAAVPAAAAPAAAEAAAIAAEGCAEPLRQAAARPGAGPADSAGEAGMRPQLQREDSQPLGDPGSGSAAGAGTRSAPGCARDSLAQQQEQQQPEDGGRAVKRRRVAPATFREASSLTEVVLPPHDADTAAAAPGSSMQAPGTATDAAAADAGAVTKSAPRRGTQAGGGRGGRGRSRMQAGGLADAPGTHGAKAAAVARGGGSGGGGSVEPRAGGSAHQERAEAQQQEPQAAAAAAWWESLTAAAVQLESLGAMLQVAAGPMRSQPGASAGDADGTQRTADSNEEVRELREEMELGERERRRMLECEEDGGRDGRRRRRLPPGSRSTGAGADGAYGTAVEADGEQGPLSRHGRGLPAAAAAALERIHLAVLGPPQAAAAGRPYAVMRDPRARAAAEGLVAGARVGDGGEEPAERGLKDELVLWVAVCGPGQPAVLHEEFLLLGSQTLVDLRDVLGCATEDAMRAAVAAAAAQGPKVAAAAATDGPPASSRRGRGCRDGRRPPLAPTAEAAEATAHTGRGCSGSRRGRGRGRERSWSTPSREPAGAAEATGAEGPVADVEVTRQTAAGGPGPTPDVAVGAASAAAAAEPASAAASIPAGIVRHASAEVTSGDAAGAGPAEASAEGPADSQVGGSGTAAAALQAAPPLPPPQPHPRDPGGVLPPSHGSYLFVEGRFYVDVRHPEAEDYTAPIRELCSAHGLRPSYLRSERGCRPAFVRHTEGGPLPPPAAMHDTRFTDLTLRQANQPTSLFCHRACCEHTLFVRDVRRWHPGDPPNRAAFPLQLRARDLAGVPVARRRCGLCEARFAELVTHDDPLAPSNPAIMCRHCFDLLHIGSGGERVAPDVVVQPYNPALDIATTQGTWAPSAAAAAAAAGNTGGGGGGGGERRPQGRPRRV